MTVLKARTYRDLASWLTGLAAAGVLLTGANAAQARGGYDTARVIRAEPIYQRVSVKQPVEYCELQQVAERPRRDGSATAPVLGAIIGGAIGNAVGSGKSNKRVGAAAGAVLGGAIGYDMSRQGRSSRHPGAVTYRTQEVCSVRHEVRQERRITGYDVTYRYQGRTYVTRTDRHPGDRIPVRVDVRPVF